MKHMKTDEAIQTSIDGFNERSTPILEEMRALWSRRLVGALPYKLTDELAAHIIKACFYASMISVEERWPKVSLHACGIEGFPEYIASLEPPVAADAPPQAT